jgi:predicted permease
MGTAPPWLRRIIYLFGRRRFDRELREEIDFHREMACRALEEQGMQPAQAATAARRSLGNVTLAREQSHDVWAARWLEHGVRDLRLAVRMLRREGGYTAAAVLLIALGVSTTTTLFSVAYGVLLRPLPWAGSDRTVRVIESRKGQQGRVAGTVSNGTYLAWRDAPSTIDAIGGYTVANPSMRIRVGGVAQTRVAVGRLTPSMFDVLKVAPHRGRAFTAEDVVIGTGAYPNPRVVMLSYGLWQDLFAGSDDAIGGSVMVDDVPVDVVGVMPRGFLFPDRDTRAWLPMPIGAVVGQNGVRRIMLFASLARLAPQASAAQAAAEATARARSAPDPGLGAVSMFGSTAPPDVAVVPALQAATSEVRPVILMVAAAASILFATALANIASLQIARAMSRRREFAVRMALGAGRARVAAELVAESALLAAGGGSLALVLTAAAHRLIPHLLPADFPRVEEIAISMPVLAFTVAAAAAATIVCGVVPAFTAAGVDVADALAADGSTSTSAATWRRPGGRLRAAIVVAQVSAACVLLGGAALLSRSLVALMHADRGYEPANVLTARLDLGAAYTPERRVQLADALMARLASAPGITDVALGNALPFLSVGATAALSIRSPSDPAIARQAQTLIRIVTPSYFRALRLRVVEGRAIDAGDVLTSRPAIVVNRAFVNAYLGRSSVGLRLPLSFGEGRPDGDVVGVVDDMRQASVTDAPVPEVFVSYRQMPGRLVNGATIIVVRTASDPMNVVETLRTAVREQDDDIDLESVLTMEERLATHLTVPRLYAVLVDLFGVLALTVAMVGLYGVLAYSVAQRRREIGVRAAVGATPSQIGRLFTRTAGGLTVAGIVIGIAMFAGGGRFLRAFVYGVTLLDPISWIGTIAVVAAAAMLASILPARRAAALDPMRVLK